MSNSDLMGTIVSKSKRRAGGAKSGDGVKATKPEMKLFAERAAKRLKAWYGTRVVTDSGALLNDLRKDTSR